ncbi:MAG: ribonuclease P protein subunit [Candidatus Micrarchaeota archaeon]
MRNKMGREYSFLLDELIGEQLQVLKASGKGLSGIVGKVLDESKNTFLLATSNGRKRIPKKGTTFYFPGMRLAVKGDIIAFRPQDRTKKLSKELKL